MKTRFSKDAVGCFNLRNDQHMIFLLQWKMFTTFFKFANGKSKEFTIKIMFLVSKCQNGRVLSLLYAPMFLSHLKSKNDSTYLFGVVFFRIRQRVNLRSKSSSKCQDL